MNKDIYHCMNQIITHSRLYEIELLYIFYYILEDLQNQITTHQN